MITGLTYGSKFLSFKAITRILCGAFFTYRVSKHSALSQLKIIFRFSLLHCVALRCWLLPSRLVCNELHNLDTTVCSDFNYVYYFYGKHRENIVHILLIYNYVGDVRLHKNWREFYQIVQFPLRLVKTSMNNNNTLLTPLKSHQCLCNRAIRLWNM